MIPVIVNNSQASPRYSVVDKDSQKLVIEKIHEVLQKSGAVIPESVDLDFNMIEYNIESIVILSTIAEVEATFDLSFNMSEFEQRNFVLTIRNILHCLS